MRWKDDIFVWKGLRLNPLIERNDSVVLHGLNSPVKYVRLVRRKLSGRNRFYVQLVDAGKPFLKPKNIIGAEIVGADIDPSTIAVVGDTRAFLQPVCAEVADKSKKIEKLQRQMARQRRENNPNCFQPNRCDLPKRGQKHGKRKLGKPIKGKRQVFCSKRYEKNKARMTKI